MEITEPQSGAKAYFRANRTFFVFIFLLLVAVSGYFWWRSGFTFDFSRFFAAESCPDASDPWQATFDIPQGAVDYRTATFHSNNAGCSRTTESPGSGGSVTRFDREAGVYSVRWNPNLDVQCGRYQFDVALVDSDGNVLPGEGVGVVFNWGVDCGVPPPTTPPPPPTTPPPPPTTPPPPPTTPPPPPTTPPPPSGSLVCAPPTQSVGVGQGAQITVSGGIPPYSWNAPNGTPSSGTGTSFTTSYIAPGSYQVGVFDSSSQPSAICYVTVQGTPTPPPTNPLECSGTVLQANAGQSVPFSATGGTGSYAWYAPGGTPNSSSGPAFSVSYAVPGFKTITVVSGNDQATCTVTILSPQTTPPPPPLVCQPSNQSVAARQPATVTASGGTQDYAWSAPSGNPSSQSGGASFSTTFTDSSEQDTAGSFPVTVTDSSGRTATCYVNVSCPVMDCPAPPEGCEYQGGNQCTCGTLVCPSVSPTPTPTPTTTPVNPALSIQKAVRNVTAGGSEQDSVTANPAQTVEFIIRISSVGSGTATQVTVRDTLPSGLSYQTGTTTVDGSPAADGIIGSRLSLGDMPPGRTITVRFRATVAPDSFFSTGTTTLVNIAFARGQNTAEVADTAIVRVPKGESLSIAVTKLGRNVSRGQTGEHTPVYSDPAQTVEFIVRVRNTAPGTLTNVTVRDVLPQGITFVPGTVRLNNQPASDILVTAGLNIGSLTPGQEAVIVFSGRVANAAEFPIGTTVRINTVYAIADGVAQISAQLPVIITRTGPPVTEVPTGPGESTILALIISAVITLLYVGYASTDSYRRHEAGTLAEQAGHDPLDFKR